MIKDERLYIVKPFTKEEFYRHCKGILGFHEFDKLLYNHIIDGWYIDLCHFKPIIGYIIKNVSYSVTYNEAMSSHIKLFQSSTDEYLYYDVIDFAIHPYTEEVKTVVNTILE